MKPSEQIAPKTGNPKDTVINIHEAEIYCRQSGNPVSARGLRKACARGYIPGARKIGRDWVISYWALNFYLSNRPKRGRPPSSH